MRDLDELIDGLRADTDQALWPSVDQLKTRARHRAVRRGAAAAVAAGLVVATAALVGAHVPARGTRPPVVIPGTSPAVTRTAALRVASTVAIVAPRSVLAAAAGHGSFWYTTAPAGSTFSGKPGHLVRVDQDSLRRMSDWPVVGSPVAVVVAAGYVWVAGDRADWVAGKGETPPLGADTVQQFDLTGRLVHTYQVPGPTQLVDAGGDAVWVEYSASASGRPHVARLRDGTATPTFQLDYLPVEGVAPLAVCPDGIYAVSQDLSGIDHGVVVTHVQRFSPGGAALGEATVTDSGFAALTCQAPGVWLTVSESTSSLYRLRFDGTAPVKVEPPARGDGRVVAVAGSTVWLWEPAGSGDAGRVSMLDTGSPGVPASVALTDVAVATTDGARLWAVVADIDKTYLVEVTSS